MVKEQQGKWVVPNPQIPRSFGLMNIIFGALLILGGGYSAASYFLLPKLFGRFQDTIVQQQAAKKAQRESKIAELKTKEDAAKTKEEKAELKQERAALEAAVEPDLSGIMDFNELTGLSDRRVFVYYVAEIAAGVLLNILMIVAGLGLMGLTEWGRRMAILVAELKILRWVLMTVVSMALVLPITLERTQKMMVKLDAQIKAQGGARGAPFALSDVGRLGAIFGAATAIFSAIVASIYPVLTIWFLTRPPARAACLRFLKPLPQETRLQPGEL